MKSYHGFAQQIIRKAFLIIAVLFISSGLQAQNYSDEEMIQGYTLTDGKVIFLFNPEIYQVEATQVFVTGSFRNWDQDLNNTDWIMKKEGNIWILEVPNKDFESIPPNAEFKFRINDGEWLSPPSLATNEKGGNLIFMHDIVIGSLRAEIHGSYTIWAKITGNRLLSKEAFRLTDAEGNQIEIAGVLPNTSEKTLITTSSPMDIKRVYFLEIPSLGLKSFCSYDGWFRSLYSDKELGANISEDGTTTITLFAPRADMLKVYFYKGKDDTEAYMVKDMAKDEKGVWEVSFNENLKGIYYDFTIHGPSDPGNYFFETNPVHFTDPYARVSDNTWGRARIWEDTKPATPLVNGIPKMEDVIAYEVHIQDFTDLLPVEYKYKGTFNAMVEP